MSDPTEAFEVGGPAPGAAETDAERENAPGAPGAGATAPLVPLPEPSPELRARLAAFEEAREHSQRRLEDAVAAGEDVRRREAERPSSSVGEELYGDVRVVVDGRGVLSDVRLGPGIADVPPDQIGGLIVAAVRNAQEGLQRPAPSGDATARLHDDRVAAALRALIEKG